jgi:hypothetical protein
MRPFFNEKASVLLTRLDTRNANNHNTVKEYLTHQFELSPPFYLEQFNHTARLSEETCISFCSRFEGSCCNII